jgi:hypothetical protein
VSALERLEETREHLPEVIGGMARIVIDNPKEFAIIGATGYVTTRALQNLVRPRGPAGALATAVIGYALSSLALKAARDRGYLNFRVRDADGKLVRFRDVEKNCTAAPGAAGEV